MMISSSASSSDLRRSREKPDPGGKRRDAERDKGLRYHNGRVAPLHRYDPYPQDGRLQPARSVLQAVPACGPLVRVDHPAALLGLADRLDDEPFYLGGHFNLRDLENLTRVRPHEVITVSMLR